ncbi:zinc finger DHHC domain-containing protein, putative [Eimeria tenella]|uniref:Palmitoyltransferase n=1 Tax=Eimeria tenella TaxID=5802 RepID=U6KM97_EIMTE|nr:zinc finger DHHC domain-containing protein, putative [Eimeria tenella]CDJ39237.1 zinc finger DHHC domain-containing protein, putative [Eimeria tenella]|eukprot:XP_013229992.1 zinc finger DHHC domain-containing protein, putative [Eimeria tenella]
MGDEVKRKRYCKVCNVWKPDRTHHCSACGRCILNMDHHCPWINNCVGFYNRRFFLQLLLYSLLCLTIVFVHT